MSYLCTRKTERTNAGAVVQLVRIQACHAWGRGFESRPHRQRREENEKSLNFGLRFSFFFLLSDGSDRSDVSDASGPPELRPMCNKFA